MHTSTRLFFVAFQNAPAARLSAGRIEELLHQRTELFVRVETGRLGEPLDVLRHRPPWRHAAQCAVHGESPEAGVGDVRRLFRGEVLGVFCERFDGEGASERELDEGLVQTLRVDVERVHLLRQSRLPKNVAAYESDSSAKNARPASS